MMRECFRLHRDELLKRVDLVLVARQSIANRGFRAVERDFLRLLKNTGLLPNSSGPAYPATESIDESAATSSFADDPVLPSGFVPG